MDTNGIRSSEKEVCRGLRELDHDDLLTLYRQQRQEQVEAWTRNDLEKELVQFYMTEAYRFTLRKLRWMIAVGKAARKLEL